MDKRDQSKKDEIILRQLEVIRSMTEHNLSRMGADFWGTPTPEKHVPVAPLPEKEKRIPPADGGEKKAPEAAEQKQEDTAKAPPKENIEDLQKELDSYVGLSAVKREVKDLINLAAVSYTHLRAHETGRNLVCRLLLEKKKKTYIVKHIFLFCLAEIYLTC